MSDKLNLMENKDLQNNIETEIDLIQLFQKVWIEKKIILKWCGIAAIIGLIVAFSIPKEYTTTVTLAPETSNGNRSLGSLSALAGMAGINIGNNQGEDALSPELYPDIVSSVAFMTELFNVPLQSLDNKINTTVYNYILKEQKVPWWNYILSLPIKAVDATISLFEDQNEKDSSHVINPFHLTKDEEKVITELDRKISVLIDKRNNLVTLSVTMQEPLISATLTDTVLCKLQNYITDYRTNKSRKDLEFTQKLFEESQHKYFEAQQQYANYVDQNKNLMLRSVQVKQERLQNEMNLAYNLYNQTAQQLQLAKAKVQENTPVYTIIQASTVPLKPSRPSKVLILVTFIFLGGLGSISWILFIKKAINSIQQNHSNYNIKS